MSDKYSIRAEFAICESEYGHSALATGNARIVLDGNPNTPAGMEEALDAAREIAGALGRQAFRSLSQQSAEDIIENARESKRVEEANSARWKAESKAKKAQEEVENIRNNAKCLISTLRSNGLTVPADVAAKIEGIGEVGDE